MKLACPITGNPQPLIEWSKNGETIDFTWTRYKANSKKGFLKILKPLDSHLDSGIFICKGINGFGTEQVHIQLVVTGRNLSKSCIKCSTIYDASKDYWFSYGYISIS